MPTYEYECLDCGSVFEVFQSISSEPVAACPQCGGVPKRLIGGGSGFLFKGSGFYQTDYRSDGYKKSAAADKPAEAPKKDEKSASNGSPKKAD